MNPRRAAGLLAALAVAGYGCAPRGAALAPPAARRAPAPPAAASSSPRHPAAQALEDEARRLAALGEHERAAAHLERAVRLAPSDGWLWYRLAEVRFAQGRAAEAEQLARKSNAVAGADPELAARNWQLIARTRRALGDEVGARIAESRARQLR
ncbi:MAG: hypothetical protein Kow0092_23760 [Deferrisomatales bacterium]